jgi:ABC-type multidrug transport system ATPase subunit
MDEATRCDRIALIDRGRLLGIDTPAGITGSFERLLLGIRTTDRYRALLALRRYQHAASVFPFGDVMHYTDDRMNAAPGDIAKDVKTYLVGSGFNDASVEPLTPTVEDVFIARTANPESRIPNPGRMA